MNLLQRAEDFLMNQLAGKVLARGAASVASGVAAWLASAKVQLVVAKGITLAAPLLAAVGLQVTVVPVNGVLLGSVAVGLAQVAFEWLKARRAANPNSPTVQTDASKPGADVSAAAVAAQLPAK